MEEEEGTGKKKVMVAIDESECSHHALQWSLEFLGDSISKSELVVFTVQPTVDFTYVYASTYGAAPAELVASIQENQKKAALALLEKAKDICTSYGVAAEAVTEVGNPKDVICEAVEKLNIQLLIMGSHGRGAIKRIRIGCPEAVFLETLVHSCFNKAFLGSVSNYCVQNAKCPVLVVNKPA